MPATASHPQPELQQLRPGEAIERIPPLPSQTIPYTNTIKREPVQKTEPFEGGRPAPPPLGARLLLRQPAQGRPRGGLWGPVLPTCCRQAALPTLPCLGLPSPHSSTVAAAESCARGNGLPQLSDTPPKRAAAGTWEVLTTDKNDEPFLDRCVCECGWQPHFGHLAGSPCSTRNEGSSLPARLPACGTGRSGGWAHR